MCASLFNRQTQWYAKYISPRTLQTQPTLKSWFFLRTQWVASSTHMPTHTLLWNNQPSSSNGWPGRKGKGFLDVTRPSNPIIPVHTAYNLVYRAIWCTALWTLSFLRCWYFTVGVISIPSGWWGRGWNNNNNWQKYDWGNFLCKVPLSRTWLIDPITA